VAAAAPDFWLGLAYGDEYVGYGYLVRWYAVLYVVVFFAVPLRAGLRALEETLPILVSNLFAGLVALATFYPLLTNFGIAGAVAGMVVVQVVMQGLTFYAVYGRGRRLA
jgi:O-antigen/teichoic acid export membrane protein